MWKSFWGRNLQERLVILREQSDRRIYPGFSSSDLIDSQDGSFAGAQDDSPLCSGMIKILGRDLNRRKAILREA